MKNKTILSRLRESVKRRVINYKSNKFDKIYKPREKQDLICEIDDIRLKVSSKSVLAKPLSINAGFEEAERKIIKRLVRPGMIVFDIGANIGLYTAVIAKQLNNKGHVFSFEPYSSTCDYLKYNVSLNELNNVTVEGLALTDSDGQQDFFIFPEGEEVYNSLGAQKRDVEKTKAERTIKVQVSKLDTYCKINKIDRIDFIKLDVEGAEEKVFEGGKEVFKTLNPIIITEIYEKSAIQCGCSGVRMLKNFGQLGYTIYNIDEKSNLTKLTDFEPLSDGTHYIILSKNEHLS
jgi:FkbM family methyltransferase